MLHTPSCFAEPTLCSLRAAAAAQRFTLPSGLASAAVAFPERDCSPQSKLLPHFRNEGFSVSERGANSVLRTHFGSARPSFLILTAATRVGKFARLLRETEGPGGGSGKGVHKNAGLVPMGLPRGREVRSPPSGNGRAGACFWGCLARKLSFCGCNPKFSGAWFRSTDFWVMSPTR